MSVDKCYKRFAQVEIIIFTANINNNNKKTKFGRKQELFRAVKTFEKNENAYDHL